MDGIVTAIVDNGGQGKDQHPKKQKDAQNLRKERILGVDKVNHTVRDIYVPQDKPLNIAASYGRDPKLKKILQRQATRTFTP